LREVLEFVGAAPAPDAADQSSDHPSGTLREDCQRALLRLTEKASSLGPAGPNHCDHSQHEMQRMVFMTREKQNNKQVFGGLGGASTVCGS